MSNSNNILEKILATKTAEISKRKLNTPIAMLTEIATGTESPRGFAKTLQAQVVRKKPAIIAEIKKASPSKGVIRADFNPVMIARDYAMNGASCISVLTDKTYFQGAEVYLQKAREACPLPILRKDFIIDVYQIHESRALGADCILLIVAALNDAQLHTLAEAAQNLGMDVLVEVHNAAELARALTLETNLIGINNRNLSTFATDLNTTLELKNTIPEHKIVITESGIHTPAEVKTMLEHDVYAFLVGEAFMRAPQPGTKMRELFF